MTTCTDKETQDQYEIIDKNESKLCFFGVISIYTIVALITLMVFLCSCNLTLQNIHVDDVSLDTVNETFSEPVT